MDEMNNYNSNVETQDDVVSVWAFLGLTVLYSIPCIGFIFMIIFACGAIKNQNIKNHARGMLVFYAVLFILYFLIMSLGVGASMVGGLAGSL